MKVPFRVEPSGEAGAADALFVPGVEAARALGVVGALGEPAPRVFAVANGYLLVRPVARALPGTIGLRAVGPNLYVPVSGRLVPALLPDEARELARTRGLLFLPGGALAFLPDDPVPLGRLVAAPGLARGRFGALPVPAPRADRLRELLFEEAQGPEAIVEAARPPVPPEPEKAPPREEPRDASKGPLGRAMSWLQDALGMGAKPPPPPPPPPADPRQEQEKQLEWLLREFREGNLERALGRALPMGEQSSGPSPPATSATLPQHDPRWNLARALEGGTGPGRTWTGGLQLQVELAREYRKVAEKAIQAGDWRRAAFVYGKLLRDWRSAAQALERGGLHHDAAILWHRKANDPRAAARAYEAANEVDRALGLYRELHDHVAAGNLLKRAGDIDEAVLEFRAAAARLEREGATGYAAAADLLLRGAERPDLAIDSLERGWKTRPGPAAGYCLVPLVRLHAQRRAGPELLRLAKEADEHFAVSDGSQAPFEAFAQLARAAGALDDPGVAGELTDRARLAIARELVVQRRSPLEASWLISGAGFGDAVVADAVHAVRAARLQKRP